MISLICSLKKSLSNANTNYTLPERWKTPLLQASGTGEKHLLSTLWLGNIKQICPAKWCSAEFGPSTGRNSCLAHSADLNTFISNSFHLGRLTQGGAAGSGLLTCSLISGGDPASSLSQLIRLRGAGAPAGACGERRVQGISSVGIMEITWLWHRSAPWE